MPGASYIGTALALGGALVAMTALSSAPSEAKRAQFKKGHFVGSKIFKHKGRKALSFSHKRTTTGDTMDVPGKDPKDPPIGKLPPIVSQPLPPGTFDPGKLPPGDGTKIPPVVSGGPLPPGTFDPGKLPPGGGTKIPPVVSGGPLPPGTFDPGKLPSGGGTKIPPVVSGEPLPPGTFDPGKLPPGGGTKIPPVVTWEPYPTKLPTGGVAPTDAPKGPSKDGLGIPVKGPSGDDNCDPCAWLKLSYDQTGLTKWLDRYRLCLTWQRGA